MPRRKGRSIPSRRYRQQMKSVDVQKLYSISEAVDALKSNPHKAKFDETVELAVKLSVDPRQPDQNIRGSFSLPHGTGKQVRVIAFCEGELADQAKAAGAIKVGAQDLADEIAKQQWTEFDVAIAHPSMMRFVGRLGRVLGPKGLMPSPKSGTVTPNVVQAVKDFQAGKLEFRNDKYGNVQVPVGKMSFDREKLVENIESFLNHIQALRPSSLRGRYMQRVTLSSTMGPGLKLSVGQAQ